MSIRIHGNDEWEWLNTIKIWQDRGYVSLGLDIWDPTCHHPHVIVFNLCIMCVCACVRSCMHEQILSGCH